MASYLVTAVQGPREWSWEGNPKHDYVLTLEGAEKPAILTQNPTTEAPTVGARLDLELSPHLKFEDKLKAKRTRTFGGGGARPEDPKRSVGIIRQHSQTVAHAHIETLIKIGFFQPASEKEYWEKCIAVADALDRDVEKARAAA